MSEIDLNRLFSMSAFEGLRVLRKESLENPNILWEELPQYLVSQRVIAKNLDFESAIYLHSIVSSISPVDSDEFYRDCIASVIKEHVPIWARLITLGRNKFVEKIDGKELRDVRAIFRQARLLDNPPSLEVIDWWDNLSGDIRLAKDKEKLQRARFAEKLSINFEIKRLEKLGCFQIPVWMALEDNTVGYDILSYEPGKYGLLNKMIEVKCTVSFPLKFYVTRNEWDRALEVGELYEFHIWNLIPNTPILYKKNISEVAIHIPTDSAKGKWKIAEIQVIE